MKLLVVTEKGSPHQTQRDGGARVVETLQQAFGDRLKIMHFGPQREPTADWHFDYPIYSANRFERRLANGPFIAEQVRRVEGEFTHILFIHVSMQFGYSRGACETWTFPMLLTPSYEAGGEEILEAYTELERKALDETDNIQTPSFLEKRQLTERYGILEDKIHVVPRGVQTNLLRPQIRSLDGPPKFCSVGSIKPQKNCLGLVRLFAKIRDRYPGATLKMIGPVQDKEYGAKVDALIHQLGLKGAVEQTGHIPPAQIAQATQEAHLHLSTTYCETFGRTIFETLASGLPNVVRRPDNAAAEFLQNTPYAHFFDDEGEALQAIETILPSLPYLSSMAQEVGRLYDDQGLAHLLRAKIQKSEAIAISDFDGTLFHKESEEATRRAMEHFRGYPRRILCSARTLEGLVRQNESYQLEVERIIAYSGSVIADGKGNPLSVTAFEPEVLSQLETQLPNSERILFNGEVIQLVTPTQDLPNLTGHRVEIYQDMAYIAPWKSSKLRSVHRLLKEMGWKGRVEVFGDGPYDAELIRYYDGTLVRSPH